MNCLLNEKVVKSEVPELAKTQTAHEKRVWEYRIGELMKTEQVLEGDLYNLFAVLMSLCDSDIKNKVESMTEFPVLKKKLDSMGLLSMIKKLVYMGNMNDLNARHKKAMAHMNLMNLYQEKFKIYKTSGINMLH